MTKTSMARWLKMALVAALALAHWSPATAAPPVNWSETGFSIDAKGLRLSSVLEQFGAAYSVRIASSVNGAAVLNMRIKAGSGIEFLDRLGVSNGFRWFVYNNTLYVVPHNDQVSARLAVGEDAVQDAKAALVGIGLFDARFGWGELPDEGVVMVSGPRAYVDLVRSLLLSDEKAKPAMGKGRQVMVFRLKYASAADRVITTRGQKETVPGMKTILTGLLQSEFGEKKTADGGERVELPAGKPQRMLPGAKPFAAAQDGGDEGRRAKPGAAARGERPRIDADPSLNAIIIYDDVSKRAGYQALISELDIEPQQIEIEALIVDIDRSQLTELGVEWGLTRGNTNSVINATAGASQGVDLPVPGATLLISNAARFYARLKALEATGGARVLAKPTVLTLDNVAAVLDLSQTAYVPLVGERVADLADITVGTMLRVVPRIVKEGGATRVRLEIDIEDGAMGGEGAKAKVTRSTISTQAIVNAQQTLMIGGYHVESVSTQHQKTPLLGDVPLFGNLFRSKSESHGSRERLFLITPRLSGTTGADATELSRANKAARRVAAEERRRVNEETAEPGAPARAGGAPNPAPGVSLAPVSAPRAEAVPPASFRLAHSPDAWWVKKTASLTCKKSRTLWQ